MLIKQRQALQNEKGILLGSKFLINGEVVPEGYKYCNACTSVLPISCFSLKGNSCKECAKRKAKEHYNKAKQNPEWLQNLRDRVNKLGSDRKKEAIEYKGGKCEDCGGVFHPCVYDFHHLDPSEKEFNLGNILKRKDFSIVKKELDKCALLCSNCHRMRHYKENNDSVS